MEGATRRYIYEETYDVVMAWARLHHVVTPNNRTNFPYYLQEYIKWLKIKW